MSASHVVLIHGLANKPPPADLYRIWHESLSRSTESDHGLDPGALGVSTSLVYWADLFYPQPLAAADYESAADELAYSLGDDAPIPDNEWIGALRAAIGADDESFAEAPVDDTTSDYERVPIPWVLKKRIIRRFLIEAHDYLFNVNDIRTTILERVRGAIGEAAPDARITLVGHSLGSVIAYDALTYTQPERVVTGLMTLGSPLGIDEVQDKLKFTRNDGFPGTLAGDWVNVFDPFDVVSRADPRLANDFKENGEPKVIDVKEANWGRWRHSATKYFQGTQLRNHLRRLLGRE